jgi:hypothetical protein
MNKYKTLQALFSFKGFKAAPGLVGKFGDFKARIIVLVRQKNGHLFRLWKTVWVKPLLKVVPNYSTITR